MINVIRSLHVLKFGSCEAQVRLRTRAGCSLQSMGMGQLYRGLGMQLGASIIMFGLALFSGRDEADGGWTEL